MAGQPQKYTNEQIVQALTDSLGLVYIAARKLGCSPNTIYSRARAVKAVQTVIDAQRGILVDQAELKLRDCVMSGEAWAVSLVLKTLGKSRGYVERQEVTGKDGGAFKQEVQVTVDGISQSILAKLLPELADRGAAETPGEAEPG